ncbi:hypothetical protein AHF37_05309 [Paragonimus kellicotti]|nr:hypothetical protein AHF37_05309 [Paragonimus kellicotti]
MDTGYIVNVKQPDWSMQIWRTRLAALHNTSSPSRRGPTLTAPSQSFIRRALDQLTLHFDCPTYTRIDLPTPKVTDRLLRASRDKA